MRFRVFGILMASGWILLGATSVGCRGCGCGGTRGSVAETLVTPTADPDPMAERKARLAHLEPPPAVAPLDAAPLPSGAKWRMVTPGAGEEAEGAAQVRAELTIWKTDGSLAYSSYAGAAGALFPLSILPGDLRIAFEKVRVGGAAQFWLPRELIAAAARAGHKPRIVPEADIVMLYEPLSFERASPAAPAAPPPIAPERAAADTNAFPAPDAAGPPPDALSAGAGVHYVVLLAGSGPSPASSSARVEMSMTLWQVRGLLVEVVKSGEPLATTPERAPAGLSKLLRTTHEGDVVRVWLSKEQASQAFPSLGAVESVCDLAVRAVGR
jgi:hypothetical protein